MQVVKSKLFLSMESENLPLQNPPFTIIEVQRHSQLEEYGEDYVDLSVLVQVDDYQHWVWLIFTEVQEHCEEYFPEVGAYIRSVRKSIPGVGDKQNRLLELLDADGFDLQPYIYDLIQRDYELEKAIANEKSNQPSKSGIVTEDGKTIIPMEQYMEENKDRIAREAAIAKRNNLRQQAFMDDLSAYMNTQVVEHFSEIFNSEPQYIIELEELLTDSVITVGNKLTKLANRSEER